MDGPAKTNKTNPGVFQTLTQKVKCLIDIDKGEDLWIDWSDATYISQFPVYNFYDLDNVCMSNYIARKWIFMSIE